MPPETQKCLRGKGVDIPDKDLTVEQVERLWKQDRKTIVALDACGARSIKAYDELSRRWR
jgi:transposase